MFCVKTMFSGGKKLSQRIEIVLKAISRDSFNVRSSFHTFESIWGRFLDFFVDFCSQITNKFFPIFYANFRFSAHKIIKSHVWSTVSHF